MSQSHDLISVLMPVYNGAPYLHHAIQSILEQTHRNIELIIINDGSIDESEDIIQSFTDRRIHYLYQENQGLPSTLNRAIKLAKGRWVARQDQDDISLPDRLKLQAAFLNQHPDYAMVGCRAQIWVGDQKTDRVLCHPTSDGEIRIGLLFYNYFVHSSVLIQKSVLEQEGGYSIDVSRQPPEDYELWCRIARKHKIANLAIPLLAYREVSNSMSRDAENPFLKKQAQLSAENIAWALGLDEENENILGLANVMQKNYPKSLFRSYRWDLLQSLLLQATAGMAMRCNLSPKDIAIQEEFLLKQLKLSYLNYRSGGILNRLLAGKLRATLKKFLKIPS